MKSEDWAIVWRAGIIALLPLAAYALPKTDIAGPNTLYPQSAAGMRFGIRLDNKTLETCLIFKSDPAPEELHRHLCEK